MKNFLKIENAKTSQIILVILMIILIVPTLLSLPALFPWLDFSKSGEIGSLIGGVTAPFINGLAALLVFLAFKAQIKANVELKKTNTIQNEANQSLKNQEQANLIMNQLSFLQEDKYEFLDVITQVQKYQNYYKGTRTDVGSFPYINSRRHLNKILYYIAEIRITTDEIDNFLGKKRFLYKKLYYIYDIKFRPGFEELTNKFKSVESKLDDDLLEIFNQIEKLDKFFLSPTKYDK